MEHNQEAFLRHIHMQLLSLTLAHFNLFDIGRNNDDLNETNKDQ